MHVSDVSLLPSLVNLFDQFDEHNTLAFFSWTCSRVQRLLHNQDLQVEDQLDTFQVRTFSSQGPFVCFLRCLCLCSRKLVLSSVSMILESCLACTWFCDRTMNVRYHHSQKCELTWSSAEVSSLLGITFAERGWSNCCYSQLPPAIDAYIKTARQVKKIKIYIYTSLYLCQTEYKHVKAIRSVDWDGLGPFLKDFQSFSLSSLHTAFAAFQGGATGTTAVREQLAAVKKVRGMFITMPYDRFSSIFRGITQYAIFRS